MKRVNIKPQFIAIGLVLLLGCGSTTSNSSSAVEVTVSVESITYPGVPDPDGADPVPVPVSGATVWYRLAANHGESREMVDSLKVNNDGTAKIMLEQGEYEFWIERWEEFEKKYIRQTMKYEVTSVTPGHVLFTIEHYAP